MRALEETWDEVGHTDTTQRQIMAFLLAAVLLSQIPVPAALVDATTVYMNGVAVERKWLDRAAKEVNKIGRWELVAIPDEADVVLTLSAETLGGGAVLWNAPGVGVVALPIETPVFYLLAQDAETERVLWRDSRKVGWMKGGAVADLVKDLFKSIKEHEGARR